jgi:hypothetical protein
VLLIIVCLWPGSIRFLRNICKVNSPHTRQKVRIWPKARTYLDLKTEVGCCNTVSAVITSTLKIEALSSSETLFSAYISARCPDRENRIWQRLENARLCIFLTVYSNLAVCHLQLPGKILPTCGPLYQVPKIIYGHLPLIVSNPFLKIRDSARKR